MVVDDVAFRNLQVIGIRQGGLTPEDLKRELPIARMSAQEIAETILRLQEVGIDVEVDASLFAPAHPATSGALMSDEKIVRLEDRIAPRPVGERRAPAAAVEPAPQRVEEVEELAQPQPQARLWPLLLGLLLVVFVIGAMFLL